MLSSLNLGLRHNSIWSSSDVFFDTDTFGTYPSIPLIECVRLKEVLKITQCLLTINIQRSLCTVVKFHVAKEAKEAVV